MPRGEAFVGYEDLQRRHEDPEHVDGDVDLSGEFLDHDRAAQRVLVGAKESTKARGRDR